GANECDHHYLNANVSRDFDVPVYADLVVAQAGDLCVRCGQPVTVERGIEVGQIFELGTKYSLKMGANYLDQDGKERPLVMGCYGIGITRTVAAVIEEHHDADGIAWPLSVAPYQIEVLPLNANDHLLRETAERMYDELEAGGLEVLLDDRDQSPGFKFKDADLIGLPVRIVVGGKAMSEGKVEIHLRKSKETVRTQINDAVPRVQALLAEGKVF
ncbi:MAG: His/Gly/Thr/Pro-type tRNA ligase C-terminal domain-containing protein, partial [Candidatus Eisenbacteria bacterium]